jgi:23S rRNA pseudouridine2457 synthase
MLIAPNKPLGVLRPFTDRGDPPRRTLAQYVDFPGVYPLDVWTSGRLDCDSEGLLRLTDDGALAHRLTDPRHRVEKPISCRLKASRTLRNCGDCNKVYF